MSENPVPRLFCFGLGYSAGILARRLAARGWRVAGTSREAAKLAELRDAGIETYPFNRDEPLADAEAALAGTTHLLSSVPPDPAGDAVLDHHGADIARLGKALAWAGYL